MTPSCLWPDDFAYLTGKPLTNTYKNMNASWTNTTYPAGNFHLKGLPNGVFPYYPGRSKRQMQSMFSKLNACIKHIKSVGNSKWEM